MIDTRRSNNLTPLIISGVARSGTRMATDLLNVHPKVVIQEEMYGKLFEKYFSFVKEADQIFTSYD